MIRPAFVVSLVAALWFAPAAVAQSCENAHPFAYDVNLLPCDRPESGGPCVLSAPIAVELRSFSTFSPTSCATVTWDFDDGTALVASTGDVPVQHQYANAGYYDVVATIQVAGSQFTATRTERVAVGNGVLRWQGTSINEGETGSVMVFRSNVQGTTSMQWTLTTDDGGTPTEISPLSGTVSFADGQASTSIAFHRPSRIRRSKTNALTSCTRVQWTAGSSRPERTPRSGSTTTTRRF